MIALSFSCLEGCTTTAISSGSFILFIWLTQLLWKEIKYNDGITELLKIRYVDKFKSNYTQVADLEYRDIQMLSFQAQCIHRLSS